MIQANEQAIRQVVQEVLAQLGKRGNGAATPGQNGHANGDWGVFRTVDEWGRWSIQPPAFFVTAPLRAPSNSSSHYGLTRASAGLGFFAAAVQGPSGGGRVKASVSSRESHDGNTR